MKTIASFLVSLWFIPLTLSFTPTRLAPKSAGLAFVEQGINRALPYPPIALARHFDSHLRTELSVALKDGTTTTSFQPIFDFSDADQNSVAKFDRIDDAIMGGISTSSLKQSSGEDFARWSGICRLDGGGFCGTRTLPFTEPIQVGNSKGLYLKCRLTSDDEPERRVWKVTTRTDQFRGEQLYQAMFELPQKPNDGNWSLIEIPFTSFSQVRGPRLVEGAAALNVSNSGIYQIGISLSKFKMAKNVTEIENFRPGFFELQIKEIGVYNTYQLKEAIASPNTLTKKEADSKRPLILKLLLPIAKIFFNEKRRRSQSAIRILEQRGMSRFQANLFGFKMRLKRKGLLLAIAQSLLILCQDMLRASIYWSLRISIFMPLFLLSRIFKGIKGALRPKSRA